MIDNLKYVVWKKPNGMIIEGFFIKTNKGYIKVRFFEEEFYDFPEEAEIYDADLSLLTGKTIKDDKKIN
jgi:hypothetical protein